MFLTAAAVWLPCFLLSVHASGTDLAFPSVRVRLDPATEYPRVDGHRLANGRGDELHVGDELLAWGSASLRGATDLHLFSVVAQHSEPSGHARVTVRRAGQVRELVVGTGSFHDFWPRLPASLIFLLTAAVFVFRSPANPLTHSIASMLTGWALLFSCTFAGPMWLVVLATIVQLLGVSASCVFGLRTTLLFPHATLPKSRVLRALPYAFAVLGPLDVERAQGAVIPAALAHQLAFALYLALLVVNTAFAVRNYRRASLLERRKLKWLLWAVWLSSLISGGAVAVALLRPAFSLHYYVALSSLVLIPLALLVSITRFNLFDIDRILSATATLSLVVGSALAVLLVGAPLLTRWVSSALSVGAELAQSAVIGALVLLSVAGVRVLHPWLDRTLFVERAALQRGLAALLREVGTARSPQAATERVGRELVRLLSPQTLAIYHRGSPCWEIGFAHGGAVAPAMPSYTNIVDALEREDDVLCFELGRGGASRQLTPLDHGLIDGLDARVVLGVRGPREIDALIFLGGKGSGDVFVRSDLALLGSIAHALSTAWARLAQEQAFARVVPEREALRSYVPGPIASQIVRGIPIEQGEQEVTLMFIDIRGYSSYAEHRAPAEVFEMVSRYTHRVSQIVLARNGTVVEFNGDGMMAVFGAPVELERKEEVAVQAAIELLEAAREVVPITGAQPDLAPIGIGISTGRAFVGSIRSSDRSIWTALGASTNRAARLQALTRELRTDLVIDDATHRALGTVRRRFAMHANVLLRGHAQRLDLYALAIAQAPAAQPVRLASTA